MLRDTENHHWWLIKPGQDKIRTNRAKSIPMINLYIIFFYWSNMVDYPQRFSMEATKSLSLIPGFQLTTWSGRTRYQQVTLFEKGGFHIRVTQGELHEGFAGGDQCQSLIVSSWWFTSKNGWSSSTAEFHRDITSNCGKIKKNNVIGNRNQWTVVFSIIERTILVKPRVANNDGAAMI